MYVTSTRQVEVEEIEDIICNRCGGSCKVAGMNFEGLIGIDFTGGYGSHLGDGNRYRFDVCETCLEEWFKSFKHDPFVEEVW